MSLFAVLAIVLATVSLVVTAVRLFPAQSETHRVAHAALKPSLASYLGVYEPGPPRYESIADFALDVNGQPNLVESFGGWPTPFDGGFAETLHQHGITPLIQIDPTDASVAAIASGVYDDYLNLYAESVADFGHPVVLGFGHEMNASWYSWGYGQVPAATFVAAWRHVVDIFREQGADNVTWLWTIQANGPGVAPAESWWPGADYVTWVGIDDFYTRSNESFAAVFGNTIKYVKTFTSKPVLLSETAVGPVSGQLTTILDLFKGMNKSKALGLVWFDVDQQGGPEHQDWRIENNPTALEAFRLGVATYLPRPAS